MALLFVGMKKNHFRPEPSIQFKYSSSFKIMVGEQNGTIKLVDMRSNLTSISFQLPFTEVPLQDVDWCPTDSTRIGAVSGILNVT